MFSDDIHHSPLKELNTGPPNLTSIDTITYSQKLQNRRGNLALYVPKSGPKPTHVHLYFELSFTK